ncbi:hypothetical protein PPIS_a0093 [Pseudoalteromonas piscicida]|uniref:Uncharacterized protein n=1 Tax=Pseudoalteromonas piscicida TaxID=43662 RepID=A0ABN5CA27_PSEO7|nr:hypothetical protein PPIS_a0093 [Pseudoalteromonas piscicida]
MVLAVWICFLIAKFIFIQFALNGEPTYKQNHVFYIEISLDTGEQFSLESHELSFAK